MRPPTRPRFERLEAATLVVMTLVALAIFAFLRIARYAGAAEAGRFDRSLLLSMRSATDPHDPLGPPWFEGTVRDITALGGVAVLALITCLVTGYLISTRRRRTALLLVVAVIAGALLSVGLKNLFERPRPDLVPHLTRVSSNSFPSGHAMLSAVVYLTLGALLAQVQSGWWLRAYVLAAAVAVALLVGASRVYLGVHWPSDVAGGFAVGSAWAGLAWLVERRLQRGGEIEARAPVQE